MVLAMCVVLAVTVSVRFPGMTTQKLGTIFPCTVEDEEPHRRTQRGGQELVLESGEMRVEP